MIIDARTPVTIYSDKGDFTFDAETWKEEYKGIIDQLIAMGRGLA